MPLDEFSRSGGGGTHKPARTGIRMLDALPRVAETLRVDLTPELQRIARRHVQTEGSGHGKLRSALSAFEASSTPMTAIVLLASLASLVPDEAPVSWMLCEALFRLQAPRALEQIISHEERFGRHPDSCVLRGRLHLSDGRAQEALAAFDEAIAKEARRAEAIFGRGKALLSLGAAADACIALRDVAGLRPRDPDVQFHLGVALCRAGEPLSAVDVLGRLVEGTPTHAQAWFQLGIAFQDLGRHGAAAASFEQALRCNPEWAEAYFNRGVSFQASGDLAGALQDFAAALVRDPACKGPVAQALASGRVGRIWLDPDAMVRDLSILHVGSAGPVAAAIDAGLS